MITRLNIRALIGKWFLLIMLLLVVLALNAYGLYAAFTSTYTGAVDFYPVWWGAPRPGLLSESLKAEK